MSRVTLVKCEICKEWHLWHVRHLAEFRFVKSEVMSHIFREWYLLRVTFDKSDIWKSDICQEWHFKMWHLYRVIFVNSDICKDWYFSRVTYDLHISRFSSVSFVNSDIYQNINKSRTSNMFKFTFVKSDIYQEWHLSRVTFFKRNICRECYCYNLHW